MLYPVRFSVSSGVLGSLCGRAMNRRVRGEQALRTLNSTSWLTSLLFLLASAAGAYPQASIDDVHIGVRANGIELATASPVPKLSTGTLIRTRSDLVVVPVTITDAQNHPVVGLGLSNFQLFENKKPQQIKNLSS